MLNWLNKTHVGDCRELLSRMAADGVRVQTCVTSPPYFGLRDYGVAGQIGLESTPGEYVEQIVRVFRLLREILSDDGTLWLNLGDSYAGYHGKKDVAYDAAPSNRNGYFGNQRTSTANRNGIKAKDLLGIPWRVAFSLQADGWYLRSDIIEEVELYCPCGCGYVLEERIWRWSQDRELIWKKPNPMCESVKDRPTKAHEYIFLLSKSQQYYFDADAIKEPAAYGLPNSPESISSPYGQGFTRRARTVGVGGNARPSKAVPNISRSRENLPSDIDSWHLTGFEGDPPARSHVTAMRNKRSVWTVATTPYAGAHFATFPRKLIDPCVLAGSRPGDVVVDPFAGSGTTRQVATSLGRRYVGCELNPAYLDLDELRQTTTGMPL